MLSTDDEFPWRTVIFLTILLTALLTMTIIYAPRLISRWFRRRDSPVVNLEDEEEEIGYTFLLLICFTFFAIAVRAN
jgi:Kef-type K+ transport system membrane component KefB